ncbi:hypothetical protein ACF3NX_14305 (plasmid) [Acetobacter orientalis]|uniref:hypothetical protein n=1 Tax=Acetobacter orientalis TaxID=146474 RepID=UPI003870DCB0
MSDDGITETDISNFLLAVVLLFVCLIPLSAIVFFDLESNSAALALSTILLLMALLWVKKKYRKPVENQSAPNKLSGSWKWFIAAVGFLPIGIVGGLMLNYFFPDNPVSIIFMSFSGIFSVCLLMLKRGRSHD